MVLGCNWFELDRVVGVNSTTGGATLIQIFFDVMPAKSTNLVAADARFEVEIRNVHFLETKWAFGVFRLVVTPIRVLNASQDMGFGLRD